MIRSCINTCLFAVISLLFGVIWLNPATALAAPTILPLGQISEGLRGPTVIDVDADGNLYVADSRSRTVVKFDKYGSKVAVLSGATASGAGLAVASDGKVYVSAGDKVAILDQAGVLLGYLGQGAGEFIFAGDIDLDINGNVYVVDQTAGQIEVFAPGATVGATFIGQTFGGTIGLSINDATNHVYISNYNINVAAGIVPSLYVYDAAGLLVRTVLASSGFGSAIYAFGDVTFDAAGNYYISDSEEGTLRVMDVATGAPLLSYGLGELNRPGSMAFDQASGLLYVLYGDARVDIYGVAGGAVPVKVNAAPTVPQSITVGEVGSLTPSLLFENATDTDGDVLVYNLRVLDAAGTEVAGFGVAEGVSPTAALVPQALVENASYSWQVQADDGQATSGWSAAKSIYVNAAQEAPTAPQLTSFVAGEAAGSDAALAWSASTDADPYAGINYRVEVSEGAALIASSVSSGTSALVASYSDVLVPGATYTWQVVAVDNTALETPSLTTGSFVFKASVLNIDSNVTGAKVYLGGHHGYAGRYLGVAPVVVRDLAEASYSVVVEAAGYEPFVQTVVLAKDAAVVVLANLDAASLAETFALHDLNLGGLAVQGVDVSPIVADLDQDGILDLLLANNGYLDFYQGSLVLDPQTSDSIEYVDTAVLAPVTNRVVFKAPAQRLTLPRVQGAAPCMIDWNNDDRLDLLIGGADGSVKLFLGLGGLNFSANGDWLVTVASRAIPVVGDFDNDGDKDLVVSSATDLLLFDNVGSDASPVLNTQSVIATLSASAAPLFVDWDADGTRDLMLLSQGELFRAVVVNKLVTSLETTGLSVVDATSVFALNFAGRSYNDFVFSTQSGALTVANAKQGRFSPAYIDSMLAKIAELKLLVIDQAPALVAQADSLTLLIDNSEYDVATSQALQLITDLEYSTGAWVVAVEFSSMLDPDASAVAAQAAADNDDKINKAKKDMKMKNKVIKII